MQNSFNPKPRRQRTTWAGNPTLFSGDSSFKTYLRGRGSSLASPPESPIKGSTYLRGRGGSWASPPKSPTKGSTYLRGRGSSWASPPKSPTRVWRLSLLWTWKKIVLLRHGGFCNDNVQYDVSHYSVNNVSEFCFFKWPAGFFKWGCSQSLS